MGSVERQWEWLAKVGFHIFYSFSSANASLSNVHGNNSIIV